jgi:hypothetical protein
MEFFENRRHFRLRDYFDVDWKLNGNDSSGQGTVLNISVSGVLLQTNGALKPFDKCTIEIKPQAGGEVPFSPKKGKIVWFRRIGESGERFHCGVEFLKDAGVTDKALNDWLEQKVAAISEAGNVSILNIYVV